MELGGHAPFIAFEDADIDQAVLGAMQSKFRNTGQTCVCANRIFVQAKIYDDFVSKFTNAVSKIKVGNGLEEDTISGPLIDEYSLAKVKEHVEDAVNTGAKIAIGGDVHSLGGNFYQPTILANVTSKAKITYEETFGPVAPVYKFSTEEEVIKMANDTPLWISILFLFKRYRTYMESCRSFRIWNGWCEHRFNIKSRNSFWRSKRIWFRKRRITIWIR